MNYIVFDLEWNQSPGGKEKENPRLPFEIIEIGAVKLNSSLEETGQFHSVIRPSVYPSLNYHTREVVRLSEDSLRNGTPFPEAVREFLSFCGGDAMFCTWGPSDLTELQRNMKYYGLLSMLRGPLHYYDVQKLFAIQYETMKSRKSLEYAADFLKLDHSLAFHQALSDAVYTARVFRTIDPSVRSAYDSIDVYQNPENETRRNPRRIQRLFQIYLPGIRFQRGGRGGPGSFFHLLLSLRTARQEKKSGGSLWDQKNYYCVALCPEHGYLKGKVRMKHTDEGKFYVVKTIKVSSPQEAEEIRQKKETIRKKRNQRHR